MPFELPNPETGNNRIEMLRSDYFKALLGAGFLFGVIALYALEIAHFHNTLHVRKLVLWSIGAGLVLGLALATFLRRYGDSSIEIFHPPDSALRLHHCRPDVVVGFPNHAVEGSIHPSCTRLIKANKSA